MVILFKREKICFPKQGLRSMATTLATTALIGGGGQQTSLNMGERLVVNEFRALVKSTVSSVIQGHDIGKLIRESSIDALIESIGGTLAKEIGDKKLNKKISSVEHKVLHSALGMGVGMVMNPNNPIIGAITGGIGGFMAEVVAETLVDRSILEKETMEELGQSFTPELYQKTYREKLVPYSNIATLVVGSSICALEQDPTTALFTATNALENNFMGSIPLPELKPVLVECSDIAGEMAKEVASAFIPFYDIVEKVCKGEQITVTECAIETITAFAAPIKAIKGVIKLGQRLSHKFVYTLTSEKVIIGKKIMGRTGKQKRLRELANDPKLGKADRGWLKQEINSIASKSKRMSKKSGTLKPQTNIRLPPTKQLAHYRGKRAKDGNNYEHSHLQSIDLHKLEHKYGGY